jgi:hypothetical protein
MFFFLKKLFLISAHQNDLKTQKKIFEVKKKINKIQFFFKRAFETQKQMGS